MIMIILYLMIMRQIMRTIVSLMAISLSPAHVSSCLHRQLSILNAPGSIITIMYFLGNLYLYLFVFLHICICICIPSQTTFSSQCSRFNIHPWSHSVCIVCIVLIIKIPTIQIILSLVLPST